MTTVCVHDYVCIFDYISCLHVCVLFIKQFSTLFDRKTNDYNLFVDTSKKIQAVVSLLDMRLYTVNTLNKYYQ